MSRRIKDYLEERLIALAKGGYRQLRGSPVRQCILVAGVQRSGTNMVMDVLDRSLDTDVYHETDDRAFDNYQMVAIDRVLALKKRSRSRCFVIKSLCELQRIDALARALDDAKVIWVVRHYHDVVNSMLVSFKNQANQVRRIVRYRTSDGWLSEGMSDQTYALLCELVDPDTLDDASAAALQWYFRNIFFYEKGLDTSDNLLLVRYEDLVQQPREQTDRLYRFCDLDQAYYFPKAIYSTSIGKRKPVAIDPTIEALCAGLYQRFVDYTEPKK
ncbi:sulfotransferase family protein [Aestuariirhabdus litorea]|uniref:Sulfotransferase n=1 Tax=Aestuariirhabdus litorea TaxID=2528527 RepID=A0A3P3VQI9_9GAMM|nr:sulfotransferase [Aestuariirhabdus litorea]RRJ84597.1 sulfotransferase [Aestuariirhabdus litorea]RWW97823.1 sulfotransferase [Endozoicomonadaceae bacterium GTF-13]